MFAKRQPASEGRAKLFRGLGDVSRLAILLTMKEGARTVSQIVAETGLTQSNVSNHLSCLRDCGLVDSAKHGRWVRYRVSQARLWALIAEADEVLEQTSQRVQACANYEEAHVG